MAPRSAYRSPQITRWGDFIANVDASDVEIYARIVSQYPKIADRVITRAVNRVTRLATTAVRKNLTQELGASAAKVSTGSRGLKWHPARYGLLVSYISARGAITPLSYYNPVQRKKGVSARPWGKSRNFRGTFILTMKSGYRGVFKRTGFTVQKRGRGRGKITEEIEQLWGPSIAREMMRGKSGDIFREIVDTRLPGRLSHELQFALRPRKPGEGGSGILPGMGLGGDGGGSE